MSVLALVIILLVLGGTAYLVNTSARVTPFFKTLINVVLVVVAVLLCLVAFGIWDEIRNIKVPRL